MTETKTKLTLADLSQFTGGLERYQTWSNKNVIYTEGVEYLAKHGEAFWLIDCITSYFGTGSMRNAMEQDDRLNWLQFWRLEIHDDHSATVTARADTGVEPFVTQHIEFTDFPLDSIDIWAGFDGTRWTLYLPSEH